MKPNRKKSIERNIGIYQLILILGRNGLIVAGIYFFFTSIKQFSPSQSLFLLGLVSLSKALAEIPTGVVADKFSRKYSIFIGHLIMILSWIGIILTGNFWLVFSFTILRGIGGSFLSGADDALLYDSLKELKQSSNFKKIFNKSKSLELISFAITILIGGYLASINLVAPVILHILFLSISAVISLRLIEPIQTDPGKELAHTGYISHTAQSLKVIFSRSGLQKGLLGIFISLALVSAVFKSTKNILSPILDGYDSDITEIGLIIAGIMLIKAFGAYIASKINQKGGEEKEILLSLTIFVSGLILITFIRIPLIQLIIFVAIISLDYVILSNFTSLLNDKIKSSQRSTILSLVSLLAKSSEMLFLTSFGLILDNHSQNIALLFTAIWLACATIVFGVLLIFSRFKN